MSTIVIGVVTFIALFLTYALIIYPYKAIKSAVAYTREHAPSIKDFAGGLAKGVSDFNEFKDTLVSTVKEELKKS